MTNLFITGRSRLRKRFLNFRSEENKRLFDKNIVLAKNDQKSQTKKNIISARDVKDNNELLTFTRKKITLIEKNNTMLPYAKMTNTSNQYFGNVVKDLSYS